MEFVEYALSAVILYLILFKPQKEKTAFWLLWLCIGLDIMLWIVASAAGWLPNMAL